MKRSELKVGAKAESRGSTFKAERRPLPSTGPIARKARKNQRRREAQQLRDDLRAAFKEHALIAECPLTGVIGDLDAHHVLEAQWIKQRANVLGYTTEQCDRALWDVRNCLGVEHIAHLQHHAHSRQGRARIPRAVVLERCPEILDFAREHGLEARFDAAYPPDRDYPKEAS